MKQGKKTLDAVVQASKSLELPVKPYERKLISEAFIDFILLGASVNFFR